MKFASSNGFLFTALALVLLAFMLASLSASSAAASAHGQTYAYRFKVEALNSMLESANDAQLSNFAHMSLLHSLSQLAHKSVVEPIAINSVGAAHDNAQTGNVNAAIKGLMLDGTAKPAGFFTPLDITGSGYTISRWKQALNASAAAAGFVLSFGEASGFEVGQVDAWNVNVKFELPLNITDAGGSFFVQKVLHANATVSIEGIYDPLVAREDPKSRLGQDAGSGVSYAKKQIFRNPNYETPASVVPRSLANESNMRMAGLGWFYGPIMQIPQQDIQTMNVSEARASIYMSRHYEGIERDGELFGAVIITNLPQRNISTERNGNNVIERIDEIKCVNCRHWIRESSNGQIVRDEELDVTNRVNFSHIVTDGTGWYGSAQSVQGKKHVLFDSEYGAENYGGVKEDGAYHRIFDIENLRDMAVCGFYVQNGDAPSFFQRMLSDALALRSPLGIESFLVGKWAGGGEDADNNAHSRLDRKFYSGGFADYTKIKGMPGCKSLEMCGSQEAIDFGVGHFGLDGGSIEAYGAGTISCGGNNGANGGGCG